MTTSELSFYPLETKDKTAVTLMGWKGIMGWFPWKIGGCLCCWSSCWPIVVVFLLPLCGTMVTMVMGVSLPVEFRTTLLDCFLAQLVSIGTVALYLCCFGMRGNGPSGNCKTVPPSPLVLAASLSFSTTSPAAAALPLLSPLSHKNFLAGWKVGKKQWLGMGCHIHRSFHWSVPDKMHPPSISGHGIPPTETTPMAVM